MRGGCESGGGQVAVSLHQRSHFYVSDQFWTRSAGVEMVLDAAAQPPRNGSEGE